MDRSSGFSFREFSFGILGEEMIETRLFKERDFAMCQGKEFIPAEAHETFPIAQKGIGKLSIGV